MLSQRLLSVTLLGAGWVLWLLVGLSVLSVAVALERSMYFFRRRIGSKFPELMQLCLAGNLAAEVVRTAEGAASSGSVAVAMATAANVEKKRIEYEQRLSILGTLGNNAPFIGLFGTVLGIIRAFADLASANKAGGSSTAASP